MLKPYFFLILLISTCAAAQEISGLSASFSFNKGIAENDLSHVPVVVVGASPVEDRFGNANAAYGVEGTDGSYLNLGTYDELKPCTGSVSLWFNVSHIMFSGTGYDMNPIILTKAHAGDDFFEAYQIGIGGIYSPEAKKGIGVSHTQSELNQVSLRGEVPVQFQQWYHVVMCYDDHFVWFYFNGRLHKKVPKYFSISFLKGYSVMVGHSANKKNRRFFSGYVDDIFIYNKVLSPEEVLALYEAPDPYGYSPWVKWSVIGSLIGGCIMIVIYLVIRRYKNELEAEREKNRRQSQEYAMEIRIRKAQMNPHFIFNAMNSVQQFILAADHENAHKYLVKFSRLLRQTIENNEDFISLEQEIELLTGYIEMESLRFEQSFSFGIITDASLYPRHLKIPQMLIQPIVENAIWHGLLPKKEPGRLTVSFEQEGNKLLCTVDDNGVGRHHASNADAGKKSLALTFIEQRLDLMGKAFGESCSIIITDKKNERGNSEGTRVEIRMPLIT